MDLLSELDAVLMQRRHADPATSYVASLPQLASMLPELPHLVHDSLLQGRRAGEQREAQETLLRQLRQEMRAQQRRQRWLIGALLLWLALVTQAQHLPGAPLLWLGCLALPWL